MTARICIFEEQRGQTMGSTSYTFAISLAQAERQQDSGTEGQEGWGDGSAWLSSWVCFHPARA
jgi:hypothetical protein